MPDAKEQNVDDRTTRARIRDAAIAGVATFLGTMVGSLLGGLGLDVWNVSAASTLGTLLGLVFGAIALAFGAAPAESKSPHTAQRNSQ